MDYGLFNYIQACIFSRLKLLFNFYVKRTVRRQDFGAKFNLTFHNGVPVADILKENWVCFYHFQCPSNTKKLKSVIAFLLFAAIHLSNFFGATCTEFYY